MDELIFLIVGGCSPCAHSKYKNSEIFTLKYIMDLLIALAHNLAKLAAKAGKILPFLDELKTALLNNHKKRDWLKSNFETAS